MKVVTKPEKACLYIFLTLSIFVPSFRALGWISGMQPVASTANYLCFGLSFYLGSLFTRDDVPVRAIARYSLIAAVIAFVFGWILRYFGPHPYFEKASITPNAAELAMGLGINFLVLCLPATTSALLATPSPAQTGTPEGMSSLQRGLLAGLLPLGHVFLLLRPYSNSIEIPIMGIAMITIPIGLILALATVILALFRSKLAKTGAWALLFYIAGAFILFGALGLVGVNFTFPP